MAYTNNFTTNLISLVDSVVAADKLEFSQMLYQANFETSNIANHHPIETGVRSGQLVPILNNKPNPESFPFVDETSCVTNECDLNHEFGSVKWDLGLIECRVGICLRSFDENFLRFFNAYRHTQEGEPDLDTAMLNFISGTFKDNLLLSQWRAAYFGDKSSASAYFNGINGFWTQAEANPALRVTITQNAEANFTDQAITGEEVYNYLSEMYDRAIQYPWFDLSSFEFKVTKSMGLKLVSWLNKQGDKSPYNCTCYDPVKLTETRAFTLEGLRLNGIPVKVFNEFDDIINYSTALNGGGGNGKRVNPHRAILSRRENLVIGTSETDALNSFDIWYDKTDKKVYLEGSSFIGAAIPMPEYIVAI